MFLYQKLIDRSCTSSEKQKRKYVKSPKVKESIMFPTVMYQPRQHWLANRLGGFKS